MNDWTPQNKVLAGIPLTILSSSLCYWAQEFFGYVLPAEQACIILGVVYFAVQYLVTNRAKK